MVLVTVETLARRAATQVERGMILRFGPEGFWTIVHGIPTTVPRHRVTFP